MDGTTHILTYDEAESTATGKCTWNGPTVDCSDCSVDVYVKLTIYLVGAACGMDVRIHFADDSPSDGDYTVSVGPPDKFDCANLVDYDLGGALVTSL